MGKAVYQMRIVLQFLTLGLLTQCSIDRNIPLMQSDNLRISAEYMQLDDSHTLLIAGSEEPGQRLTLCLQFVDKGSQQPLPGQVVHFYHTDVEGNYRPAITGDETSARLSGSALTDSTGRIMVQTILPGNYGSRGDNRHIHTSVPGAIPSAYDIHFKQFTGFMGRRFIKGSDQHFLAELVQDGHGQLLTILKIEVKT